MFGFNPDKLSIKCHLCVKRMSLVRNRKSLQIQGLQSEVADILKAGQEQNARIKVEEVIRQEMILEAYALLETYLILLQTRAGMLKKAKDPPPDMIEAMCTIIFASERVKYELDEMPAIAAILMSKFRSSMCQLYGKDFPQAVMDEGAAMGRQIPVSPHVAQCLSVLPASPHEKIDKLQKIATQFGAPFDKEKAAAEMLPRNPRMPTVPSPYDKPGSGGVKFYQPATKPDGAQRPVQQPTTTVLTSAAVTSMTTTTPAAAPPRVTTPNKDGWRVQLGDGLATTLPPPPHALAAAAPLAPARPPVTAEKVAPSSPDPWAPLPPLNQNLGYTFDARLDQVAQFMVHKQSGSQSGSQSGGTTPHRGNSLVPQQSDASITSKMSGGHGTMAVSDAGTGTEAPSEGGHREESDAEDDLAKRLAALRAM